jgi:RimJ/RimL family protein N-acetyltransferase
MLLGERIRLRALEREDIPLFVEWLNDPEVRQYLLMDQPISKVQEEDWFETMHKQPPRQQPLMIEVSGPQGWTPIGDIALFDFEDQHRSAELGILIGEKQYWNLGYGREAVGLLLKHGFNTLNLHRIYLWVYATNLRGIHSYENAGFVYEGRKREAIFQDGKYIDLLLMGILRQEWLENVVLPGEKK